MKRPWALPLVPLYWSGLKLHQALTRERRLQWPVISVGSVSAGGAGKTPAVKMIAELLARRGMRVDVLSRGYGRSSRTVERVDPEGEAERFGDEPLALARDGLRVFVGGQRFHAGRLAEAAGERRIHLLDDGFQHRRLARTLNIVLLTLKDVEDWLLPAGNLREPLSALRRADVLVIREEEAAAVRAVAATYFKGEYWIVNRRLVLPEGCSGGVVAFCGLARPEDFLAMLKLKAVPVWRTVIFPDHYRYRARDLEDLVTTARACGAAGFVTTAKDEVKLSREMRARLEAVGPLWVAGLQMELVDEGAAADRLETLMR